MRAVRRTRGADAHSVLREVRPSLQRCVLCGVAAVAVLALGWLVGVPPGRAALLAAAAVAVVLVARAAEPVEQYWPEPPGLRSRPGTQLLSSAQRQMESARTDRDSRWALQQRTDRLDPADPRVVAARRAVGLRGPAGADASRPTTGRSPR